MAQDIETQYFLFGGHIRNLNVQFGFNQTPTVITLNIAAPKNQRLTINNRSTINLSVGAINFNGIVQSWEETQKDIGGSGLYDVRITDTKPVLDAAQVIIVSPFSSTISSQPFNYGDNVITVLPQNSDQITEGVTIQQFRSAVQSKTLKYGNVSYTVRLDLNLPSRGVNIQYLLRQGTSSLLSIINQITADHGLDWYVETDENNIITIRTFNRNSNQGTTLTALKNLHNNEIVSLKVGKENRDVILKAVLIGANKTYLNEISGNLWEPFWGMQQIGSVVIPKSGPDFSIDLMEKVINRDYEEGSITEEDVQSVLKYANEFWGRKFITRITPFTAIDNEGKSWVIPTTSAWWDNNTIPADLNIDGQLKFQTEDGRWQTFVKLPFPGSRSTNNISYQWEDSMYSSPNTHFQNRRELYVRADVEVIGSYFVMTLSTPMRLKKISTQTKEVSTSPGITTTENDEEISRKTRATNLNNTFVALLDRRVTYGPWFNRFNSVGKTEVIIDDSLSPWAFGFRGITNTEGTNIMAEVARAKLKTIADTVLEADIFNLIVAGEPQLNIGTQINKTGAVTNIQVSFSLDGVKTTYASRQFTNDLSRYQKYYNDLIEKLRRQADLNNNNINPPDDELFEPPFESNDAGESRLITKIQRDTVLGRIYERVGGDEPKYNLIPMAWVSDSFGELTLVRDPSVFGQYLRVVNMSEKQTAPGRLPIGLDVELKIFSQTENGIISYYMDIPALKPDEFNAIIDIKTSNAQPRYKVIPIENEVQEINLISSEILALNDVLNIGEPPNFRGNLQRFEVVRIHWNENPDGTFTPFISQQLNLFKPVT